MAAVLLVMVGLATGALRATFRRRDWGIVVLLGLFGNTLFHSLLVTGVHRTSPGHAAILVAMSPVLAALLARLLYGEPVGARRMGGIALGFLGVAVIVMRGSHGTASIAGRPAEPRREPVLGALHRGREAAARPGHAAGRHDLGHPRRRAPARAVRRAGPPRRSLGGAHPGQWLLLAYLSAGTIALANLLWYVALARTATARVVAFSFLIPLIATTIAVLAGQEALTLSLALGAAAVLGGVALAHRA